MKLVGLCRLNERRRRGRGDVLGMFLGLGLFGCTVRP